MELSLASAVFTDMPCGFLKKTFYPSYSPEVCRLRQIPIFTFANKMDREGREPIEIIDDVENTLGIRCYPVTWPIGMGGRFVGLYHRLKKQLILYTRGEESPQVVPVDGWKDKKIMDFLENDLASQLQEDMALLEGVLGDWSKEDFLCGQISPMTFGSAKFSWGVDLFLELFAQYAPPPSPRKASLQRGAGAGTGKIGSPRGQCRFLKPPHPSASALSYFF